MSNISYSILLIYIFLNSELRHPNVLQFLGTASNPPELVIIMEFMARGIFNIYSARFAHICVLCYIASFRVFLLDAFFSNFALFNTLTFYISRYFVCKY